MNQRATGRTTRMLEAAVKAAYDGKFVAVICANKMECGRLLIQASNILRRDEARGETVNNPPSIRIHGAGVIHFETLPSVHWDWNARDNPHPMSSIVSIVDHWPVEQRIAQLEYQIRQLLPLAHKWDADGGRAFGMTNEMFRRECLCTWPDPEPPPLSSRGEPTKRRVR